MYYSGENRLHSLSVGLFRLALPCFEKYSPLNLLQHPAIAVLQQQSCNSNPQDPRSMPLRLSRSWSLLLCGTTIVGSSLTCNDNCTWASDGTCEDPANDPWALCAYYSNCESHCELGTDCSDCGDCANYTAPPPPPWFSPAAPPSRTGDDDDIRIFIMFGDGVVLLMVLVVVCIFCCLCFQKSITRVLQPIQLEPSPVPPRPDPLYRGGSDFFGMLTTPLLSARTGVRPYNV